ncbi:HdeD family acid-resistance protein [Roseovarius sp. Pro17]|uniref:HdeD family acid-resistance protein n=1 Tax=Roseovarius sp. Pro17 TaxID=3108175 RepID=UPI002D78CFD6|nr:HdeD family acid-resistance protein [Roseovarius sp. Pro17]
MEHLINRLAQDWWVFLIRGIAAIIFGIAAFIWPGLTLAVLIILFAAYVLVDGIFGLVYAIRNRARLQHLWIWVVEAILGIAVGLLTFFMPGVTALVLLMFIAAWAIVGGVLRIAAAVALRKQITGEWLLIAGGALSVLFGILLIVMPGAGIISVVWLIGLYSVLFGVLLVGLAMRLKGVRAEASNA